MSWTPIKRGKVEVVGRHPQFSGLLQVRVPLTSTPPAEWQHAFNTGIDVIVSLSMHKPELRGREVWLRPPDAQLEAYVRSLDERIAAANTWFENNVLPQVQARTAREQTEADEEARRLAEARKRAEKL